MWDWVREMKESKPLWWYLAHSSWAQHTLLVQEPRAPAAEGWGLQRNCRETSKPWWAFQPIRSLDIQMFPGAWRGRWQGVLRKRETSKQASKQKTLFSQTSDSRLFLVDSFPWHLRWGEAGRGTPEIMTLQWHRVATWEVIDKQNYSLKMCRKIYGFLVWAIQNVLLLSWRKELLSFSGV